MSPGILSVSSIQLSSAEARGVLQAATQRNKKLFVMEAGNLTLVQVQVKVAQ